MARRRYTPKLKAQVVLEVLARDKTPGQIAKAYGVHPNSVALWRRRFIERAPEVFAEETTVNEYERRIRDLEQLLGKKEVEIALPKNSWAGAAEREGEGGTGPWRVRDAWSVRSATSGRAGPVDVLPHPQPGELRREVRASGSAAEGDRRGAPGGRVPEGHHGAPGDVRAPCEPQGGRAVAPVVGSAAAARSASKAERDTAGDRRRGGGGRTCCRDATSRRPERWRSSTRTSLNSASLATFARRG